MQGSLPAGNLHYSNENMMTIFEKPFKHTISEMIGYAAFLGNKGTERYFSEMVNRVITGFLSRDLNMFAFRTST